MASSQIKCRVRHKILGDIFIIYNKNSFMITDVFISDNEFNNIPLSDNKQFKIIHNEVYDYLKNFSKSSVANFPIECLDLSYLSPFQRRVHRELFSTKIGDRLTYKSLAELSGSARAYRAVGTAMSVNRLLILIPCHRVLAANGFGGYRGGLNIKQILLNIECCSII